MGCLLSVLLGILYAKVNLRSIRDQDHIRIYVFQVGLHQISYNIPLQAAQAASQGRYGYGRDTVLVDDADKVLQALLDVLWNFIPAT